MPNWTLISYNMLPHGYCLSWQPHLLWLHALADLVTAIAYYTIPAMLLLFVRRRRDLQFSWIFVLFGVFIMACGATHVMSLWTLWVPDYLAAGVVKAVTATASVGTAIMLWPLIPKALALPGPAQWAAVHDELRREVAERRQAERQVTLLNHDLEQRVLERTAELEASNARLSLLREELEQRVCARTRELSETQGALLDSARQAGMAEIATNVLHNVGNVLNSVNISAGLACARLRASRAPGLELAVGLLQRHAADLGAFLTRDEKGRQLPDYLAQLAVTLARERGELIDELTQLSQRVDHIKEIVAIQQSYAGASGVVELVPVAELVEDALRIGAASMLRHEVRVMSRIGAMPALQLDRHRVLQILMNLLSNAKQALAGAGQGARRITIEADLTGAAGARRLLLRVIDEGDGIAAENLTRIFGHGFTTRKGGHGFGLHSCALAAREMGGALSAASDGPGRGARFTLELPVPEPEPLS